MLNRIVLGTVVALSLVWGASSARGELICAGEDGPVLVVGNNAAYRLTLSQAGRKQDVELERWGICFRCAGLPSLRLDLKGVDGSSPDVQVRSGAWGCDEAALASGKAYPEKYCIGSANVWFDGQQSQSCRFPEGTTLARLWTALTHTPPPEEIGPWWRFPPERTSPP
ncbi:MAG: hypothetical protein HQL33_04445 [Alphaproteobacteria bacterium]|nr:hypothetical protein [Alphaproteobacteria bacterium]